MASQGFIDLDELVLLCRNEKARSFIQEAVQCYRAGAFRQAIVATWIAIVYDIIHKFQELELAGDANASKHLEKFEKIRQSGDLKGSLEFERNILNVAQKDFELISDIEFIDLARLQEDRNRCAHPAMNTNDEIYQPSPELARSHLRNAIEHLLQRPPVQGKAALNRLISDIESDYFPTNAADAIKYFSAGPLVSPRPALVRNLVVVLTKSLLDASLDVEKYKRMLAALLATIQIHRGISIAALADKLNEIIAKLSDSNLPSVLPFLHDVTDTWQYLIEDSRIRVANYVKTLPTEEDKNGLFFALRINDLTATAVERIMEIDHENVADLVSLDKENVHPSLVQRAIALYKDSGSFARANFIGTRLIIPLAKLIPPADVEDLVRACAENSQIRDSFDRDGVLNRIRKSELIPAEDFDALLVHYGLREEEVDDDEF